MNSQSKDRDVTSIHALGILPELYPFDVKHVQINGRTMSYFDHGPKEAPPVICVHGNPTWSFYYRQIAQSLGKTHRVLALDHIGCGLSEKPSAKEYPYTLKSRVNDLTQWIEHLDLAHPFDLIVHDWGGMIGGLYATRYPHTIRRLVALNTACFHLPKSKRLPFTLWLGRNTIIGTLLIRGLNAFSGMATRWACMRPLSPEVSQGFTAPYHNWATRVATLRFVQDIPLKEGDTGYELISEAEEGLARLSQHPVFLGWGLKDFVFDHHFLSVWQSYFPDAEVVRYPDAGHYVLEDAADDLIPKISDFLSKTI